MSQIAFDKRIQVDTNNSLVERPEEPQERKPIFNFFWFLHSRRIVFCSIDT